MVRSILVAVLALASLLMCHLSNAEVPGMPEEFRRLGQPTEVVSLSFSPDGKQLSGITSDGRWRIWNLAGDIAFVQERQLLKPLMMGTAQVDEDNPFSSIRPSALTTYWNLRGEAIAISDDSDELESASSRHGNVWKFDVQQPLIRFPFRRFGNSANVAVSPSKNELVVTEGAFYQAGIGLFDFNTGRRVRSFEGVDKGQTDGSYSPLLSPDGRTLSASIEEGVGVWDVDTGKRERIFPGSLKPLAFSPDGGNLLIATKNYQSIECRRVADGSLVSSLPLPLNPSMIRASSPFAPSTSYNAVFISDARCYVFTPERKTKLWNVLGRGPRQSWTESDFVIIAPEVVAVALSPDKKKLATGHVDGTVTLWDVPPVPAN